MKSLLKQMEHVFLLQSILFALLISLVLASVGEAQLANTKIAFTSARDGNEEIYIMNPDGTEQVNLTKSPESEKAPTWSPDGKQIAFQSDGDGEIYVMNADGTDREPLTDNNLGKGSDIAPWTASIYPAWSPDGERIAFSLDPKGDDRSEIFVIDANGNQVNLTNTPVIREFLPAWSPDGRQIAYVFFDDNRTESNFEDDVWDIFVMNANGGNRSRLTNSALDDIWTARFPKWSPDGEFIAFTARDDELFVMRADGSTRPTSVAVVAAHLGFSWSPDGTQIAFVSERDAEEEVYVINRDDGTEKRLTNPRSRVPKEDFIPLHSGPAWSPFFAEPPVARTLHVPADFFTIHEAIEAANDGDTVLVDDGVYAGGLSFGGKAITVRSVNGPTAAVINGEGSHRGVTFNSGETRSSILNGFTITNGVNPEFGGGGIFCTSNPIIANCIIAENKANNERAEFLAGGGIICDGSGSGGAPIISNCLIVANTAVLGGGIACVSGASPTIINCTITGNVAEVGGGIFSAASKASVINTILWGNDQEVFLENENDGIGIRFSDVQAGRAAIAGDPTAIANSIDRNNINAPPLFADAANGDFSLLPNSRCIDAGTADNAPNFDIIGNPRPFGAGVDIGAFEFQEAILPPDDGIIRVPEDFPTIQAAIDAAESGDTVQVAAGTYRGPIQFKNGITLQGAGAAVTTIAMTLEDDTAIISFEGIGSGTIDGFTLDGGGIIDNGLDLNRSTVTISNNIITNINGDGIFAVASGLRMRDNQFLRNGDAGIRLRGGEAIVTRNTIEGNGGDGLVCEARASATITDNTITSNQSHGIRLSGFSAPTIRNNQITENSVEGINAESSSATIEGNTISGNGDDGIEGSSSDLIIRAKNIITKNGGAGIDLTASDATIEGNEIRENGQGIGLDNNSGGVVKGNTITQNEEDGIWTGSGVNTTITDNTITGNRDDGIECDGSFPTIEGNTVTENTADGVFCTGAADPTIVNNTLSANREEGIDLDWGSQAGATIENNQIIGNLGEAGVGVWSRNHGEVIITDNQISKNAQYGVDINFDEPILTGVLQIRDNQITANGETGIANHRGRARIRGNVITGNGSYGVGIWFEGTIPDLGTDAEPGNNRIHDNLDPLQLWNETPHEIHAVRNYWGPGTEEEGPAALIGNGGGGVVIFEPWLGLPVTFRMVDLGGKRTNSDGTEIDISAPYRNGDVFGVGFLIDASVLAQDEVITGLSICAQFHPRLLTPTNPDEPFTDEVRGVDQVSNVASNDGFLHYVIRRPLTAGTGVGAQAGELLIATVIFQVIGDETASVDALTVDSGITEIAFCNGVRVAGEEAFTAYFLNEDLENRQSPRPENLAVEIQPSVRRLVELQFEEQPPEKMRAGETFQFTVVGVDSEGNPVEVGAGELEWTLDGDTIGELTPTGAFEAQKVGTARVVARAKNADTPIIALPISVEPDVIGVDVGGITIEEITPIVIDTGLSARSDPITVVPGDPAEITLEADPPSLPADDRSQARLTIFVAEADAFGNPVEIEKPIVTVRGTGSVSDSTPTGNGFYTATYTAGSTPGEEVIIAAVPDNATLATLSLVLTPETIVVSIDPAEIELPPVGEQLDVNINIAGGQGVAGYQITVVFDPTVLGYISIENADYLPAGAFANPPIIGTGSVTLVANASLGASSGDGTLATATFEVIGVKAFLIGLTDVILSDLQSNPLDVRSEIGTVTLPTLEITHPLPNQVFDVNENELLTITVEATGGKPPYAYLSPDLPEGAALEEGAFSWTPTFEQAGEHAVTFTVTDGGDQTASVEAVIQVKDVNRAPELAPIEPPSDLVERTEITIRLQATDPDEDALTFSYSPQINGASLNQRGVFQWTPSIGQAGRRNLTFRVTDGRGGEDNRSVRLDIASVDTEPPSGSITLVDSQTVEDTLYVDKRMLTLELTAADNISPSAEIQMRFRINGAQWTKEQQFTESLTREVPEGDGENIIEVQFVDAVGNRTTPPEKVTFILDTTPPEITHSPINSGAVGTAIPIRMEVSDVSPFEGTLHYRPGGESEFDALPMNRMENTLTVEIPASALSKGVSYYLEAEDTFGRESTFPEQGLDAPIGVAVSGAFSQQIAATKEAWQLFSVPVSPNLDLKSLLDNAPGEDNWAADVWNGKENVRTSRPAASLGRPFWLISQEAFTLEVNGSTANPATPYTMFLQAGWNLVANPYLFPVPFGNVHVVVGDAPVALSEAGSPVRPRFWRWRDTSANDTTDGTYDDVNGAAEMWEAWSGYWILANAAATLRIEPFSEVVEPLPAAPTTPALDWLATLSIGNRRGVARVQLALAENAQWGYDPLDVEQPPLPTQISLSLLQDEQSSASSLRFQRVSLPTRADEWLWDAQMRADENATLTLSDSVPAGYHAYLEYLSDAYRVELPPNAPIPVPDGEHRVRIRLTQQRLGWDVADAIPTVTQLLPNYPNPFNPETWIPFTLSEASDVEVTIYDTKGHPVRQLSLGHLPPGRYSQKGRAVYWDGRNDVGEQTVSGVYFVELKARAYRQVRRMVMLK